ncbi:MAG: hypothetical protein V7K68_23550 [Nostoc sp.]
MTNFYLFGVRLEKLANAASSSWMKRDWGLGTGDWGLGTGDGDWGLGIG